MSSPAWIARSMDAMSRTLFPIMLLWAMFTVFYLFLGNALMTPNQQGEPHVAAKSGLAANRS
jgi:hypothetical protein